MEPVTLADLLILPVLLTLFAAFSYLIPVMPALKGGDKPRARWVGIVLALAALYVGFTHVWDMHNPGTGAFYRASLIGYGKKIIAAHYVAALLPATLLGVIAFLEFKLKKPAEDYGI